MTDRCEVESVCKWNFVRTWYCSLPAGHDGPHRAYENHDTTGGQDAVAWVGPWAVLGPGQYLADVLAFSTYDHGGDDV